MLHAMQSVADRSKAGIPEACWSLAGPSLNENFNVCHRGALSARFLRLRHSHAQQMPALHAPCMAVNHRPLLAAFLRRYYCTVCPLLALLVTRQNRQGTGLKFKIPATVQFKTVKQKLSDGGRNGPGRAGPSGRLIKPV